MYCDEKGIKYIHAVECYLTKSHTNKVRDNYHTVLVAKNYDGLREINSLISLANTDESHFYYVGRISFDEFLNLSDNVIRISACLASPLNKLEVTDRYYEKLVQKYDYLEIQPHNCEDQKSYNRHLACLAEKYHKPLIAGTDSHSVNQYKAECRQILLDAKKQHYEGEDKMDLVYKSYEELVKAFESQDAIPKDLYLSAIDNTNKMADLVESFELDRSIKYPILYGSKENDEQKFTKLVYEKYQEKLDKGIIPLSEKEGFDNAIKEELRVFQKIGMSGFMLSMSEIVSDCKDQGIPFGFARGSVGGSRVAYITDIIDVNPEKWHTVFSRFCNEDRKEIGDIDVDVIDTDRPKIFDSIIKRFTVAKTARVPSYGTARDLEAIELIGRAFRFNWELENPDKDISECEYSLPKVDEIKKAFKNDEEKAKKLYPKLFYYYEGLTGVKLSQSVHPAGIVISPITLADNYGVFKKDDAIVLQIDMEEIHEVGLVKYDLLILKTIQVISETCKLAKIEYPKSHEINWDDKDVWTSMINTSGTIFQFESPFAMDSLKKFQPHSIFDMALVTAAIRPSGTSYRNELLEHKTHHNPSKIIDELLTTNNGYLIYQEDTIKFLQQICGLSGSEADNVRRAIGRKDEDRLKKALPSILEGYCSKSISERSVAEQEAKEFLKIIEDSASYQFGYNHAIAYCMLGYLCAYYLYYYPYEFCTAYLNCAKNDEQILAGERVARSKGIEVTLPKFGASLGSYYFNKNKRIIAKGIGSVKFLSEKVATELYEVAQKQPTSFMDVLSLIDQETSIGFAKIEILINIGFFDQYGNQPELLLMLKIFAFLKNGKCKSINKQTLATQHPEIEDIVKIHSTDKGKDEKILKSYKINDGFAILQDCETMVKSLNLNPWNFRKIIHIQQEYLGYVDITTNKPEDRQKLYISKIFSLKGRNGEWAKKLIVRSLGTGNECGLTLKTDYARLLEPISEKSVIYVPTDGLYKDKKGYWNLTKYSIVK